MCSYGLRQLMSIMKILFKKSFAKGGGEFFQKGKENSPPKCSLSLAIREIQYDFETSSYPSKNSTEHLIINTKGVCGKWSFEFERQQGAIYVREFRGWKRKE